MSEVQSGREYSEAELKAMRRLGRLQVVKLAPNAPGRGEPYFATGDYWLELMNKLAVDYAKAAEDAKLVVEAMRREFERWPAKESQVDR